MKRIVKQIICLSLVVVFMLVNCINVSAEKKDKDVSYSEIMAGEGETKAEGGANIDIEAEEIFGGGTASTEIDGSTKKTEKADKNAVDETPKTGMEDTSVYVPLALLLIAAVAITIVGVNRFGRKRYKSVD